MLLNCEIIGKNDSDKATELLTEALEKLLQNGRIVPREIKERRIENASMGD